jgi:hypothetical protein
MPEVVRGTRTENAEFFADFRAWPKALKNALKAKDKSGPPPIADGCMPVLMQDFWAGASPEELEGTVAEKKPASDTGSGAAVPDDGK